ncbi:MAG: hypothetical protein ACRDZQ_04735, partial [Acidimicrobiales bacterium]
HLVGERDRLRGAAEEATAGRARLDAEVLALRAALSQEQEAAARSQAEAAEARRRESAVAADLAGVLASRSWRAAAVFRSAGSLIRGGRPRPRSHPRPGGGGLDR